MNRRLVLVGLVIFGQSDGHGVTLSDLSTEKREDQGRTTPLQKQWPLILVWAVAAFCEEMFEQTMMSQLQAEVEPYVAHTEWVAKHYSDALADDDFVWAYTALGRLHENQANYPVAESLYRHCLNSVKSDSGPISQVQPLL